jgi:hypothetical protein
MRDNYDGHKVTLSGEEARKFEERAIKAGFAVALLAAGTA